MDRKSKRELKYLRVTEENWRVDENIAMEEGERNHRVGNVRT